MQYLLDANALITAHNTWYGLNRVPEFWKWLRHHGTANALKLPAEIYAEVETGTDALAAWMKDAANKRALLLAEDSDPAKVQVGWRDTDILLAKQISSPSARIRS